MEKKLMEILNKIPDIGALIYETGVISNKLLNMQKETLKPIDEQIQKLRKREAAI